jgi:hypothetical protein
MASGNTDPYVLFTSVVLRNELFKIFIFALFKHKLIKKSTLDILCIRKGSTKHHESFSYFFGNDTLCFCITWVIHTERKKSWLTHILSFFFAESRCPYTTYLNRGLHLHSKYLMRKWRMAHFVDCHQWVFPTSNKNNTKSIHRWSDGESASVGAHMMTFTTLWCEQMS